MTIFDTLMDSEPLFLTGNIDTVYAMAILDLKRDGATVVEVPPKCGPGTVNDAYFRFVTDMGFVRPDRGAGGKYLILPPEYAGDLYFAPKAPTEHDNNWIETIPGKGWMVLIRLYGPLEP